MPDGGPVQVTALVPPRRFLRRVVGRTVCAGIGALGYETPRDQRSRRLVRPTTHGQGEEVVEHFGVHDGQRVNPASIPLGGVLVRRQLFERVQRDMEAALDRLEPFADFGPTRVGANVAHAVARTKWTIPFTSLCGFRM